MSSWRRTRRRAGPTVGGCASPSRLVAARLAIPLGAALLVCAACASGGGANQPVRFYAGPQLPRDQVARIGSPNCGDGVNGTRLLKINERPGPNKFGYGSDRDGGFCLELQPGSYDLLVGYSHLNVLSRWNTRSRDDLAITFTAQAGHDYVIDPGVVAETWQPKVMDAATGAVVGSHGGQEQLCKTFVRALGAPEDDPTTCKPSIPRRE